MLVRVLNENIYPYEEMFRERLIRIEPQAHIEMDEDEAMYFLGQFRFPVRDGQGRPDPKHFKKLKIHPEDLKKLREKGESSLVCHANGQKATTPEELAAIMKKFAHMVAEGDAQTQEAEVELLRKENKDLKKNNKALQSRMELIEEKLGLKKGESDVDSHA
jgi:hypothetical protein